MVKCTSWGRFNKGMVLLTFSELYNFSTRADVLDVKHSYGRAGDRWVIKYRRDGRVAYGVVTETDVFRVYDSIPRTICDYCCLKSCTGCRIYTENFED